MDDLQPIIEYFSARRAAEDATIDIARQALVMYGTYDRVQLGKAIKAISEASGINPYTVRWELASLARRRVKLSTIAAIVPSGESAEAEA